MYPYGYSDKGPGIAGGCGNIGTPDWVDFRETPMAIGAAEIYYWSMDPADLDRVPAVVTHAGAQHGVQKSDVLQHRLVNVGVSAKNFVLYESLRGWSILRISTCACCLFRW